MRVFRRREFSAEERARFALIAALDGVADLNYRTAGARIASDIRRGGAKSAQLHLADITPLVAESFGALARLNPICAALAAYGRDGLDIDIASLSNSVTRERIAEDRLDRVRALAVERQRRAVAGAQQRRMLRTLTRRDTP